MFFCPKCNFLFDIKKSSNVKTKINQIPELFEIIKTNNDLSNYIATFSKEKLVKNKKYTKLNDEIKNEINKLFINTFKGGAEFKCVNCNNYKIISKSISLYEINFQNNNEEKYSLEKNKLLAKDPILPRTKDYTCKNINCITHKDNSKKEAIYYKEDNSYNLKYICTVCNYGWNLN